jgi:hypothetical protein
MQVNYNLGAAQFETISGTHQRIVKNNPQQTLTEYTASMQELNPGTAIFPPNDPPRSDSPIEVMEAEDARVNNEHQIREVVNRSMDNAAGHVRQYYEAMDERSHRGQVLMARA